MNAVVGVFRYNWYQLVDATDKLERDLNYPEYRADLPVACMTARLVADKIVFFLNENPEVSNLRFGGGRWAEKMEIGSRMQKIRDLSERASDPATCQKLASVFQALMSRPFFAQALAQKQEEDDQRSDVCFGFVNALMDQLEPRPDQIDWAKVRFYQNRMFVDDKLMASRQQIYRYLDDPQDPEASGACRVVSLKVGNSWVSMALGTKPFEEFETSSTHMGGTYCLFICSKKDPSNSHALYFSPEHLLFCDNNDKDEETGIANLRKAETAEQLFFDCADYIRDKYPLYDRFYLMKRVNHIPPVY